MQKKVLTEQALYYGDVAMPKDWDIDRDKLSGDILQSVIKNKDFPFSRTFDMLNTYMRDHIFLDYGFTLVNKDTFGNIYYIIWYFSEYSFKFFKSSSLFNFRDF